MAKGLLEHEIFDLLGDGNVSKKETNEQFDNEKLTYFA